MNDPEKSPPPDPGRKVRVVAAWVIGLLLAATAVHLVLLPPKVEADAGEAPAVSGSEASPGPSSE